jgi:hypothetical protein
MPFDPRPYVRELEDGSEHLDLKWQLVWLRGQHPDARIETQLVAGDSDVALCRATVSLPSGGAATAHGSARRDGNDESYVELAENRALARALAAVGFGAEFADEDHIELRPRLAPPVALMTARALKERDEGQRYTAPDKEDGSESDAEPEPTPARPQRPAPDERPPVPQTGADINWNKFWEWARPRGYRSADELSKLLDVDILALTPAEVRRLLVRYELEHPPAGTPD